MRRPESVHVLYIASSPERLWEMLTCGELTRGYWFDRRIESEWRPGAAVCFFDGASDRITDSGEVLEWDPPRRLVYSFRVEYDEVMRDRGYSRVAFTLEPHEDVVKLTLVHDQLPDWEWADILRERWALVLSSLKTCLETGTPLPLPSVRSRDEHRARALR